MSDVETLIETLKGYTSQFSPAEMKTAIMQKGYNSEEADQVVAKLYPQPGATPAIPAPSAQPSFEMKQPPAPSPTAAVTDAAKVAAAQPPAPPTAIQSPTTPAPAAALPTTPPVAPPASMPPAPSPPPSMAPPSAPVQPVGGSIVAKKEPVMPGATPAPAVMPSPPPAPAKKDGLFSGITNFFKKKPKQ